MKISAPTAINPAATIKTMPAETSFANLASSLHFLVTKSITSSIGGLKNPTTFSGIIKISLKKRQIRKIEVIL